jgi:hypothetical protein
MKRRVVLPTCKRPSMGLGSADLRRARQMDNEKWLVDLHELDYIPLLWYFQRLVVAQSLYHLPAQMWLSPYLSPELLSVQQESVRGDRKNWMRDMTRTSNSWVSVIPQYFWRLSMVRTPCDARSHYIFVMRSLKYYSHLRMLCASTFGYTLCRLSQARTTPAVEFIKVPSISNKLSMSQTNLHRHNKPISYIASTRKVLGGILRMCVNTPGGWKDDEEKLDCDRLWSDGDRLMAIES